MPISPPALTKIYHTNFLYCVKDCIEDIATFTALAKFFSVNFFYNTKVAGLGKILSSKNFTYMVFKCQ